MKFVLGEVTVFWSNSRILSSKGMNDQFQSLRKMSLAARKHDTLDCDRNKRTFAFVLVLGPKVRDHCTSSHNRRAASGISQLPNFSTVELGRACKRVYMTDTTEGLPMDVAKEARFQQEQQQQDHKKELDRNDAVRARLLAISQIEPVGDVVPVDAITDIKGSPQPSPKGDKEDEFRRKLMSISYTDVPLPAQ